MVVVEVTARDQETAAAPVRSTPKCIGQFTPLIVSNPSALTNREQYDMWSRPRTSMETRSPMVWKQGHQE